MCVFVGPFAQTWRWFIKMGCPWYPCGYHLGVNAASSHSSPSLTLSVCSYGNCKRRIGGSTELPSIRQVQSPPSLILALSAPPTPNSPVQENVAPLTLGNMGVFASQVWETEPFLSQWSSGHNRWMSADVRPQGVSFQSGSHQCRHKDKQAITFHVMETSCHYRRCRICFSGSWALKCLPK